MEWVKRNRMELVLAIALGIYGFIITPKHPIAGFSFDFMVGFWFGRTVKQGVVNVITGGGL